jgi:hypothetical protein
MLYYKWWLRKGPRKGKPKQVFWHGIVKREGKERYIELYEHLAAYVYPLSANPHSFLSPQFPKY